MLCTPQHCAQRARWLLGTTPAYNAQSLRKTLEPPIELLCLFEVGRSLRGAASTAPQFLAWALREVHSEKNSALALALRAQLPLGAGWLLYTLQLPDPTGSVVSWGWPEATKGLPLVWRFPGPRQRCGRSESTLASPHGPKKWLCSSDDVFPLQRLYLGGP